MAGLGDDQLQTLTNAAVLFGESGNDQIGAIASSFAVLDGGAGDDVLMLGSSDALVIGGPGDDLVITPKAEVGTQWLEYDADDQVKIGDKIYGVLRRQDVLTGEDIQVLYLQGVEEWERNLSQIPLIDAQYQAADLLHALQASSVPLQLVAGSRVEISSIQELNQIDNAVAEFRLLDWSDSFLGVSELEIIEGSVAELYDFLLNHASRFSSLPETLKLKLNDNQISASDLLKFRFTADVALDASSVQVLTGSEFERRQVFGDSKITIPPSGRWHSVPADGVFGIGESLEFVLAFDQPMQWNGSTLPVLQLSDGLTAELDLEASTIESGHLLFRHQTTEGQLVEDLTIGNDSLLLASVSDLTNSAGDLISGIEAFDAAVAIDGALPTVLVSVAGRVYRPGEVINYSLEFSEPVRWQGNSETISRPSLLLSNGSEAKLASDIDLSSFANTHHFDLLIGAEPTPVDHLQVDKLLGEGFFVDHVGNAMAAHHQHELAVRNAPDVRSFGWNLDVNGDNKVDLYTDGIILIRYLLFGGDSPDLVVGNLATDSNRSSAEIVEYLQLGESAGFLDLDRSGGPVSLYSDGLLMIRGLLGLNGSSLVKNVISAQSLLLPIDGNNDNPILPTELDSNQVNGLADLVSSNMKALGVQY